MNSVDMQGKIVMVTGATGGIGKETAKALHKMGARVVIVGRNPQKIAAVVEELKGQHPSEAEVKGMLADLSSLADIRKLAEDFKQKYNQLDVLVNNAGAYFTRRIESVDGFEMTFALNHLGYFYLTDLLLDLLKARDRKSVV